MRRVIIGIHGLGNKPAKTQLKKWWKAAIREGLRKKGIYFLPFKFKMVYWADMLHDRPLAVNSAPPYKLNEIYIPSNKLEEPTSQSVRKKMLDALEWQMDKLFLNKDMSINFEEISNNIIKKYFRDLQFYYSENLRDKKGYDHRAKDVIRKRLIKTLNLNRLNKIMLVSHSMGSIIAYDVLTLSEPAIKINTFVTIGSPLGLPVIMCKNAAEQKSSGKDITDMTTPPGVKKAWYNLSDLHDIIAVNYDLADDYKANAFNVSVKDFQIYNDYEINGEPNPHKSYGYLRCSEFAEIVYNYLIGDNNRVSKYLWLMLNKIISLFRKPLS